MSERTRKVCGSIRGFGRSDDGCRRQPAVRGGAEQR
jgi:hypothetical protein